jgi:AcrR family transcriptional regulator
MSAQTLRARVRAEMIEEIKSVARRHLAVDGANLSLRAVARDLGMVSSAVYRYFASRDELLTALILDAYNALGLAAEQAEAAVARSDLAGRWLATCRSVRDWGRANPHEYALIYGSPVPGYAAPKDTVAPASRVPLLLVTILRAGYERGRVHVERGERIPRAVRTTLAQLGRQPGLERLPEAVLARAVTAWVHLFGLISFELFGRLDGLIDDIDAYFDYEMGVLARRSGISIGRPPSSIAYGG